MAFEYENQFREAHPETVGEKDKHFDLDNYKDFLESRIKELEALKDEVLKVWNEDGDNGEIQWCTPIAWHRVLRIAEKL